MSRCRTDGGQETTLVCFYTTIMHLGGVVVVPDSADESSFKTGGNAYGYSHKQGAEFPDDVKAAIGHQKRCRRRC